MAHQSGTESLVHPMVKHKSGANETSQTSNPVDHFVDFQRYDVNFVAVNQQSSYVYNDSGYESLLQYIDIMSLGFEWVLLMSWVNQTNSENTVIITTTEGLVVHGNTKSEFHLSISASLTGLEAEIGGRRKVFTKRETSNTTAAEKKITVFPNSAVYFYQKRYRFHSKVWFALKYYSKLSVIKDSNNDAPIFRLASFDIESNEFATLNRPLIGTTIISASEDLLFMLPNYFSNKRFADISQKAKDELKKMGITGQIREPSKERSKEIREERRRKKDV